MAVTGVPVPAMEFIGYSFSTALRETNKTQIGEEWNLMTRSGRPFPIKRGL